MQICDICGDAGFDEDLAVCSRCNDSAEHIYCMATMLESVPVQWVCESCEMEEKGSTKKNLACSEPLPIGAAPKNITNDQSSSYLETQEAKNVAGMPMSSPHSSLSIQSSKADLKAQSSPRMADKGLPHAHNISNVKEEPILFSKVMPDVKACLSKPRKEGAPIKAAGPSSSCLQKTAVACKVSPKGNVNVAGKNASNLHKSLADRPLSGSKRVFSRSSSFPFRDDQLNFLLPSRPKDLTRSKSVVVRPSATWTTRPNIKSSYRDGNSNSVKKRRYNDELTHPTYESATSRASQMMERGKSTLVAEPKTHRQAGECKNKEFDRPSRDSEKLQFNARSSDYGKKTDFQHFKEPRRCYKCNEVGHVAAQCSYSSSSSPRVGESRKAPASFDKSKVPMHSFPETPSSMQSKHGINSPKESTQWKPQKFACSLKPACNKPQIRGKEGLAAFGTMNKGPQLASELCGSRSFHEKRMMEQVQSPKGRSGTPDPVRAKVDGVQGNVALRQARDANAMTNKPLQGPSNPACPSKPQDDGGIGEVASREAGSAVDMGSQACCEIVAEPCVQILWSGCFSVSSTCLTAYNGMQAHASAKADPRVSEAIKSLPFELHLEEMKRGVETDTWPRSFQNQPPTSSSIGVYFFPVDMECHDTWYKPLLDHLASNDLALRTSMEFFQLLIFPSQLLPEADQCWDDRQYLWGILRSATLKSSPTPALRGTV